MQKWLRRRKIEKKFEETSHRIKQKKTRRRKNGTFCSFIILLLTLFILFVSHISNVAQYKSTATTAMTWHRAWKKRRNKKRRGRRRWKYLAHIRCDNNEMSLLWMPIRTIRECQTREKLCTYTHNTACLLQYYGCTRILNN